MRLLNQKHASLRRRRASRSKVVRKASLAGVQKANRSQKAGERYG
jgi:hypothetical protein